MLNQILITCLFVVGGISLFLMTGQFFVKVKRTENYNLMTMFFVEAILFFQFGFAFNGFAFKYPQIMTFHLTFLSLLGVLNYYAFYYISMPGIPLPKWQMIFILPSLFVLPFDICYLIQPSSAKFEIINYLFKGIPVKYSFLILILFFIVGLKSFSYYLFILIKLYKKITRENRNELLIISMVFMVTSSICAICLMLGYSVQIFICIKLYAISAGLNLIAAFIVSQHHPQLCQLLPFEKLTGRSRSHLTKVDNDKIQHDLKLLMEDEKIYLMEDLTLKAVARELSITPHQLSEFLNSRLKISFNNYINKYRVNEAKQLLIEEYKRPVVLIAESVGFTSRSSFFRVFMQITGKTPHRYRLEHSGASSKIVV